MIGFIFDTLRQNPELAIFLAIGLGYWIGAVKFGSFTLGSVTGTLLAGILVGQLGIEISPHVKYVFFMLFLFAVGYGVGPQFVTIQASRRVCMRDRRPFRRRSGLRPMRSTAWRPRLPKRSS